MKNGELVTPALGNVHIKFGFAMPYCFRVKGPYRTDGLGWSTRRPVMTAA